MADESPAVVVRLEDVAFAYPDGTAALQGVSATIRAGESVALVGPNGAGKSTLALLLAGFHQAARGTVEVCGLTVVRRNLVEVRRRFGLVFQNPDDQLFLGTVLDDVAFGPLNLGLSDEAARSRALEALERVGLADAAARFPGHLSAGQKRAAAIATVLAMRPDVLLLDEPTANLDPSSRRRVIRLIHDLPGTRLVISHDLEAVLDCCARTVLLDRGRVVADGPSVEVLADGPLLAAHGLEKPHSLMTTTEHADVHRHRHESL
jgi:cobalt/nickel transport system ATP-binding protein